MFNKFYETMMHNLNNYGFEFFNKISAYVHEFNDSQNDFDNDYLTGDDLDDYLNGMSGIDAFRLGCFTSKNFYYSDDIFAFNGYGNLESYSSFLSYFKDRIDFDYFIEFMIDNYPEEVEDLISEY